MTDVTRVSVIAAALVAGRAITQRRLPPDAIQHDIYSFLHEVFPLYNT